MIVVVQLPLAFGSGFASDSNGDYPTAHAAAFGNNFAANSPGAGQSADILNYLIVRGLVRFGYDFSFLASQIVSAKIVFHLDFGSTPHSAITNDFLRFIIGPVLVDAGMYGILGGLTVPTAGPDTDITAVDPTVQLEVPLNADGIQWLKNRIPQDFPFGLRTRHDIESTPPTIFPVGEYSDQVLIKTPCYLEVTYDNTPPPPIINPPVVETDPATSVFRNRATLNGLLNNDGGEGCFTRFEYGLTVAYGTMTPENAGVHTGGTFQQVLTGLIPNRTYHFRARARNSAGTSLGADLTFTTPLLDSPTVQTNAATLIHSTDAQLNGQLLDDGGEGCFVSLEYGTTVAYGTTTAEQFGFVTGNIFNAEVIGLLPATTYHFRARARNSVGTVVGNDRTFTTPVPSDAVVVTNPATSVTRTTATLNGTLAADGGKPCFVSFEYGLTTGYGSSTPEQSGFSTGQAFSQVITGLTPNTVYHFRAVARN